MKCPRCQQENPQGARFCNACGTRLEIPCAACGHVNTPESRFCNQCGQPVHAGATADRPQQFGSPQSYTPKHLAEKILTSRSALGLDKLYRRTGKRQQAQKHLGTAITMYREMDMRFWLEQAEAETKERA